MKRMQEKMDKKCGWGIEYCGHDDDQEEMKFKGRIKMPSDDNDNENRFVKEKLVDNDISS